MGGGGVDGHHKGLIVGHPGDDALVPWLLGHRGVTRAVQGTDDQIKGFFRQIYRLGYLIKVKKCVNYKLWIKQLMNKPVSGLFVLEKSRT